VDYETLEGNGLVRLRSIAQSSYAGLVRELFVHTGPYIPQTKSIQNEDQFIKDLATTLPLCLLSFSRLNALNFSGLNTECRQTDRVFVTMCEVVIAALQCGSLSSLLELRLNLPTLLHFSRLHEVLTSTSPTPPSIKALAARLQCLQINVNNQFHINLREPAKMDAVVNLVKEATNLKALSLASSNLVDADSLELEHLNRLEALRLDSLRLPHRNLIQILDGNKYSLRRLAFHEIVLKNGTWAKVLHQVTQLPLLKFFEMLNCSYSRDGEHGHDADWTPDGEWSLDGVRRSVGPGADLVIHVDVSERFDYWKSIDPALEGDFRALEKLRPLIMTSRRPLSEHELMVKRYGFWS
jgi:hypothetical protein